jgi:hypothetical protein
LPLIVAFNIQAVAKSSIQPPLANSSVTVSPSQYKHANCSADLPFESSAVTSMPLVSSDGTQSGLLCLAAVCSSVDLQCIVHAMLC